MDIITIILAVALFVEAVAIAAFAAKSNRLTGIIDRKQKFIEAYREEFNRICDEKIKMKKTVNDLKEENRHLSDLLSQALTENEQLIIAAETQQEEPKPSENAAKEGLPEGVATNRYDCEGYKFPTGTHQAMLQEKCFTSPSTGMRFYSSDNVYYCVAMGGAYGIDIGDTWLVTLRNGNDFYIILADYQHDITKPDPDDFGERYEYDSAGNIVGPLRNYDGEECVHVLEFIADIDKLPQAAKDAGGMHGLEFFGGIHGDGGNIEKIKYLGRKWEP